MGSKFHFSKWKTYLSQFIDEILKFGEMEYLIHRGKFEIWPALCKFPFLFSTEKIKLFQPIYRLKIATFESWS